MNNLVEVQYARTGKATNIDELGMREMQAVVYAQRHRQHLLVKAPPASGKEPRHDVCSPRQTRQSRR